MTRAGRDLPRVQRRRPRRARLGRRDVDRHGVRARRAGAAHAARGHPPARVPADARRRRRPRRAAGDRHRLHQARLASSPLAVAIGLFALLLALRYAPAVAAPGLDRRRRGAVGRDVQVGDRPGHRRARGRARDERLPARRARISSARPRSARSFREQPTPELARSAQQGVLSAISPNERLQYSLHPWTSYVIVPLFALANAGIHVTSRPARATRSPRRSRSASSSATWSASRSASSAPPGSPRGRRCTGRARR